MYKTIPVQVVGGSNPSRSKAVSQERTLNLYPESVPSGSHPSTLYPWPGSTQFSDGTGSGASRGIYTHERTGVVYKVADTTLYSMDSNGVETSIGTIAGSGLVIFESLYDNIVNIGTKLLITSNTKGYVYDVDSGTLTEVTDTSYVAGGSVVAINSFAIWQLDKNRYAVGDVGDPASIQAENISTTITYGDDLVRIFKFKETIYMMGSVGIEPYYLGSSGTNPLVSIQNSSMPVGLIDRGCVDSNDYAMYWVGNDKVLYRATAYQQQSVTTPSIAGAFFDLDFTGARVKCIKFDGQNFVMVLTNSKSWVYCETTNVWIELAYTASEAPYLAYDYTYAYGTHYIQSRLDSRVLKLEPNVYTDNNQTTIRERITSPINGGQLGIEGGRFMVKRAEIVCESGIGNLSEVNPLIMISNSIDFGQSFSNESWIRAGRDDENNLRVKYDFIRSCRQIQFKIRTSDPNFFNFQSFAIDVQRGGQF